MLGSVVKVFLVLTAFAPVMLVYAFTRYVKGTFWPGGFVWAALAILLTLLCVLIIEAAKRQLRIIESFTIQSIKVADQEVLAFVLTYLVPLANLTPASVDGSVLVFAIVVLIFVALTTHSYHFNPLLGLFGYHFYEVATEDGIAFVLMTRRGMRSKRDVRAVVQLTDYMVMEKRL